MLSVSLLMLIVEPSLAFVAGAHRPRLAPQPAPSMMLTEIDLPTVLLAKSEADEVIEEVFLAFPIIVAGGLTSAFVVQYIKNLKPLSEDGLLTKLASDAPLPELPELPNIDLPEPVTEYGSLVAVPAFTVVFFLAAKAGFLGTFAGLAAKTSFDAWNIFAQIVLPGAILKY